MKKTEKHLGRTWTETGFASLRSRIMLRFIRVYSGLFGFSRVSSAVFIFSDFSALFMCLFVFVWSFCSPPVRFGVSRFYLCGPSPPSPPPSTPPVLEIRIIPELYQKYARIMPETYQNYAWNMPEFCQNYARNITDICQNYARNMPESCQKYVRIMP